MLDRVLSRHDRARAVGPVLPVGLVEPLGPGAVRCRLPPAGQNCQIPTTTSTTTTTTPARRRASWLRVGRRSDERRMIGGPSCIARESTPVLPADNAANTARARRSVRAAAGSVGEVVRAARHRRSGTAPRTRRVADVGEVAARTPCHAGTSASPTQSRKTPARGGNGLAVQRRRQTLPVLRQPGLDAGDGRDRRAPGPGSPRDRRSWPAGAPGVRIANGVRSSPRTGTASRRAGAGRTRSRCR